MWDVIVFIPDHCLSIFFDLLLRCVEWNDFISLSLLCGIAMRFLYKFRSVVEKIRLIQLIAEFLRALDRRC